MALTKDDLKAFQHLLDQRLDQKLKPVISRLDKLDKIESRLDGVEKRLDGMDKRLDAIEKRLDSIEKWIPVENTYVFKRVSGLKSARS